MDGTDNRVTEPHILPLTSIGGSERRICQVLAMGDGAVLALQAICVDRALTLFASLRATGSDWSAPALLAVDLAVPAVPSMTLAPVVLQEGEDFAVAWPLDGAGLLLITPRGGDVLLAPGRVTALCGQGGALHVAVGSQVFRHQDGQGWQKLGPALAGPVTALALFAGHVHAATASDRAGFDLSRLVGDDWEAVMTRGAWRYASSPRVTAMAVVGARLLVAADGPDLSVVQVGDEHPELLTVDEDGGWSLLSGQARFTPEGLRLPVTAGGPGVPGCAGLTVGGIQPLGAIQTPGVSALIWLRPRGDAADGLATMALSGDEWSPTDRLARVEAGVTSLAVARDGTVLIAAGADVGAGMARRPLLTLRAPR